MGDNNTVKKTVPVLNLNEFEGSLIDTEDIASIFIPKWHNRPIDLPPVLCLNNIPILTYQNTSSIIAQPGLGKSSICEAIAASYLNPEADCLGFNVNDGCRGVIYIDFERTNLDVWNSFYRMCRRAGIAHGEGVKNVKIAGMRSIPRLKERLAAVDYLLQNNPCDLLLLDGAGDLVTDTNDLPQAIECRIFLRELTVKYQISILTTLHPNPGTVKPRGHIGSEVCRESECVLLVKKSEGDCRIITSEFDNGKNRNNAPITAGYKWSEDDLMFVSVDIENYSDGVKDFKAQAKRSAAETMAKEILPLPNSMTDSEVISAIMNHESSSESTAKRRKKDMIGWGIITRRPDGRYQLRC